jgi:hypothetical protein
MEEDGKSWLRRPKLYKSVVEPHKKKYSYDTGRPLGCFVSIFGDRTIYY